MNDDLKKKYKNLDLSAILEIKKRAEIKAQEKEN